MRGCVCGWGRGMDVVRGAYLFSRSASSIQRGALQLFGLSVFSSVGVVFFSGGGVFLVCVCVSHGLRCFLGGARCGYGTFVLFVTVDSFLGGGVAFSGKGLAFAGYVDILRGAR